LIIPRRLQGASLVLWGRHELYVMSLAALLSQRGAEVRVLAEPSLAAVGSSGDRVDAFVLESPLPSQLAAMAGAGPAVIVLAEHVGTEEIEAARSLGAYAALDKNASLAELSMAIGNARGGRDAPGWELTRRQRQVLELLADGLDNAQIATRLGISQRTARAHVSSVLERLGVENRTQAAVAALRSGWLG
jgi:DNA-binding NarL/FixJ family response regulator